MHCQLLRPGIGRWDRLIGQERLWKPLFFSKFTKGTRRWLMLKIFNLVCDNGTGMVKAMFRAIGIGSSRSLPSAAALNWVLKDWLGQLSRCIYTASLGSAFNANLKAQKEASYEQEAIYQYEDEEDDNLDDEAYFGSSSSLRIDKDRELVDTQVEIKALKYSERLIEKAVEEVLPKRKKRRKKNKAHGGATAALWVISVQPFNLVVSSSFLRHFEARKWIHNILQHGIMHSSKGAAARSHGCRALLWWPQYPSAGNQDNVLPSKLLLQLSDKPDMNFPESFP